MSFKSFMGKSKYLITGLVIGSLLTSGIVYAAGSDYVLSLFQAKLVFNGQEKQGSDKPFMYYNGQEYVPTSLIYNGTTYVPLRFFTESMNQAVKYEGETETIYVGSVPDDGIVEAYMSDILKPYYKSNDFEVNSNMSMAGNKYSKGYKTSTVWSGGKVSFNLATKYKTIEGLVGLDDLENRYDSTVEFYGDDKLIKEIKIPKGSLPQSVSLNVEGIIKFDIKYTQDGSVIDFANFIIK